MDGGVGGGVSGSLQLFWGRGAVWACLGPGSSGRWCAGWAARGGTAIHWFETPCWVVAVR